MNCVFCKIIENTSIPRVLEDDTCIVIKDINPKAEYHLLIIPKRHFSDIVEMGRQEPELGMYLFKALADLIGRIPALHQFRLIGNTGQLAGQTVFHMHWHILAGNDLPGFD